MTDKLLFDPTDDSVGATFSPCRTYRYRLYREWNLGSRTINFLMLNPSTADERVNDPTIDRIVCRAWMLKFDRLVATNLFALRSTDPSVLKDHADPVGPDNDNEILKAALESEVIVFAWGRHGKFRNRDQKVIELFQSHKLNDRCFCLTVNADGTPKHPLYQSYSASLIPWATWKPT